MASDRVERAVRGHRHRPVRGGPPARHQGAVLLCGQRLSGPGPGRVADLPDRRGLRLPAVPRRRTGAGDGRDRRHRRRLVHRLLLARAARDVGERLRADRRGWSHRRGAVRDVPPEAGDLAAGSRHRGRSRPPGSPAAPARSRGRSHPGTEDRRHGVAQMHATSASRAASHPIAWMQGSRRGATPSGSELAPGA